MTNTPNVPDRVERMTLEGLTLAAEEAGWVVEYTTNVHLTRIDGTDVLVETFDRNGNPYLYQTETGRDELVEVGNNLGDGAQCLTVGDVLDAAQRIVESDDPHTD